MIKKMYGKRTLAFLLAAVMLLTLAACGGGEPAEDDSEAPSSSSKSSVAPSSSEAPPISDETASRLDEATVTNPEVKSWLTIPNTNIDYPVLQSLEDNFKYEDTDVNGGKSTLDKSAMDKVVADNLGGLKAYTGAIYYDQKVHVSNDKAEVSKNMLLYGHNWTNIVEPFRIGNAKDYDVMFAQLQSYTDEAFAKENPYIYLSTDGETKTYKIFSIVYFNAFCSNYIDPNPDNDKFSKLLDDAQARTLYKYNTPVSTDDSIVTLITCSRRYPKSLTQGDGFNIQRFAVLARLLRDGETDKDAVTVTKNTGNLDPKWTMKTHSLK
ncbi:MAG: class B sortase [Acetanaerobacterium sp.]